MEDNNIKSYDAEDSYYSGSDEEYAEFLKTVDGKFNAGEPVEDAVDLGETKTINLQGIIDKFRKTAGELKDVSKKLTSDAVNKIEDFRKASKEDDKTENIAEDPDDEGVVMEVDEIKSQIEDAVKNSISDFNGFKPDISSLNGDIEAVGKKIDEILSEAQNLREVVKDIEINSRDGASSAERTQLKVESLSNSVEEIRQAVSSISRLNDSIFDLKNAQLNAKNSLENLETSFSGLKKKCVLGITIVSILTLVSIAMSVIILLS